MEEHSFEGKGTYQKNKNKNKKQLGEKSRKGGMREEI